MNRKYVIGHFSFDVSGNEEGYILQLNYGSEGASIYPDWGMSGQYCKTEEEAAISTATYMYKTLCEENRSSEARCLLEECLACMYAVGLIPEFIPINMYDGLVTFVYHGGIWTIDAIANPDYPFARQLNHYFCNQVFDIDAFQIKDPAMKTLFAIMWSSAVEQARRYYAAYEKWEDSWIDGPENCDYGPNDDQDDQRKEKMESLAEVDYEYNPGEIDDLPY